MILKLTSGYHLDLVQIARMLEHCAGAEEKLKPEAFAAAIGISAARAKRLWMMGTALGLFRKGAWVPTALGRLIAQRDPFLDDAGTLWLLHYVLAADPEIMVWNTMASSVLPENRLITATAAKRYFDAKMDGFSTLSHDVYLTKEISAFFNAYTVQAFAHLDYLRTADHRTYVRGDGVPIPPAIFLAAVMLYRGRSAPNAATIDIPLLANAASSPGRIFGITQREVRDLLDLARGRGDIYVESRADLDQVRFPAGTTFLGAAQQYYEER